MAARFWSLYHRITPAEAAIEPHLAALGRPYRFQHPILGYFADFAFVADRLILEVDGASHRKKGAPEKDAQRDKRLEAYGWRVLRVTNEDVFSEPEAVARLVSTALQTPGIGLRIHGTSVPERTPEGPQTPLAGASSTSRRATKKKKSKKS